LLPVSRRVRVYTCLFIRPPLRDASSLGPPDSSGAARESGERKRKRASLRQRFGIAGIASRGTGSPWERNTSRESPRTRGTFLGDPTPPYRTDLASFSRELAHYAGASAVSRTDPFRPFGLRQFSPVQFGRQRKKRGIPPPGRGGGRGRRGFHPRASREIWDRAAETRLCRFSISALRFFSPSLSLSLSLSRREGVVVAEHPSHSLFSWLPLTRGKLLGNAITFATAPLLVLVLVLPEAATIPRPHNVPPAFLPYAPLPWPFYHSLGIFWSRCCRKLPRRVDRSSPRVTKLSLRVIFASNATSYV
jgi:hypothetical protein